MADLLVAKLQELFIKQKWTLSIAESCTGGAVSARLTRHPGASQYFLGGFVVYSNQLKETLLHIDSTYLSQYGAVSKEIVLNMVKQTLEITGSDFSIAISGIAGPTGGNANKPVGTVWIAIMKKGETAEIRQLYIPGNREDIIAQSTNTALETLFAYAAQRE